MKHSRINRIAALCLLMTMAVAMSSCAVVLAEYTPQTFESAISSETANGLYDSRGNQLATWSELVNTYGLDVERDHVLVDYQGTEWADPSTWNWGDPFGQINLSICKVDATTSLQYVINTYFSEARPTALVIPEEAGVTKIGAYACQGCETLINVKLPSTIKTIGKGAFKSCFSLKEINLPESVVELGDSSFMGTRLKSVTIPDSVTFIPASAFAACTELETVKLGNNVDEIGAFAFICCYKLKEINLPDSLLSIGMQSFCLCKNLKTLTVPAKVAFLGPYVFAGCETMEELHFEGQPLFGIPQGMVFCNPTDIYVPYTTEWCALTPKALLWGDYRGTEIHCVNGTFFIKFFI